MAVVEEKNCNRTKQNTHRGLGQIQIIVHALCLLLYSPGLFSEPKIENDVRRMVYQAYTYVLENGRDMGKVQHAFEHEPRFRDDNRNLYIFMHAYNAEKKEAICVAQGIRPELVGKNMWNLRTPSGRLTFQEQTKIFETTDEFWLEYEWLNPYTQTIEIKRSFFKKIVLHDGRNAWIGCGYWK